MASPQQELTERLDFAVEIAREAGEVTLRYFRRRDLAIESKADRSPVTIADRSAEELLRKRICERYPDDGIIGEEHGTATGSSGYDWTLDPIDGTKSFIHGIPLYTTLVAVLQNDRPLLGVIHAPALCETVYAGRGCGCWYVGSQGGKPQSARVSNVKSVRDGLVLTTEIEAFRDKRRTDALNAFLELQRAARLSRTWGDAYGYLMVATGRAEAMIDPLINLWDVAPLHTIIEEAGGRLTNWRGETSNELAEALATNGLVHDEVLGLLREG